MNLAQRLSAMLLIVVTTTGATFTLLVAGGSGTLDLQSVRLIFVLMAAVALIPWLAIGAVVPRWRPSSRLMPALLLCIAVFAISTVTSRVPRLSVEMLGYAVLLVEVYLLLVALMRRPAVRQHFQRLAVVMCVIISVIYLVQVAQAWLTWWDLVGHLAVPPLRPAYLGLLTGPNPVATAVLLLGALGLASSFTGEGTGRIVVVLVGALVLLTTFITASRGAWLGAGLGVIAVISLSYIVEPDTRRLLRAKLRSRRTLIASFLAGPGLVGGVLLAVMSGRLSFDDGGLRAGFTRASIKMFEASPLTGVGPGTWQTLRAANTLPTDPDLYIPHAHSIYVQTLAEFGVGGILAGTAFMVAIGVLITRSIRSGDLLRRRISYATLFGVVVVAGQQYADMLMNVPTVLLSIALLIACLDATSQRPVDEQRDARELRPTPWRRAIPLSAALVTLAITVGLVRIESIAGVATRGVEAANDGDWSLAESLAGEAAADDPDMNAYRFELGVSAANAGDLQLAAQELAASASADDYRYAWLDLAAVRWRLGDANGARTALARAERLGLQRTALAVAAGWLRQQLGDEPSATQDYASAIRLMPTLADDPFWISPMGPPGGLARILETVQERADPMTMLQINLILGRFDLAEQYVATLGPADPAVYALLIPAWQGDPAARTALHTEAANRPLDPGPARWSRLLATYQGDESLANDYGTWLAIDGHPDDWLPQVGRIRFEPPQALPRYFLDGYRTLYRRPVPDAQVVGLLPQLVLQDHF